MRPSASPRAWISDQGDGTYVNPVLHADYSDLDVIRVGEDFYMTASSFGHLPGLPILHAKDLVNWTLINHVLPHMTLPGYERPQHGGGVWAPALRFHAGKYWVFYGDPDVGIFMSTAEDPAGEWTPLHLVQAGKGLIDPCPLWDDDGQAYLVHAFAKSRSGIKHKLRLCRMAPDGKRLLDDGPIIYDGTEHHPTLEGPKLYKRDGYYYIFAPAGGVATGWQTVLRSTSIYGPYEDRIVLQQGDTPVNGPHQGGYVELDSGESWFLHFQDKGVYGRIVHLQPMRWVDGWPRMGTSAVVRGVEEAAGEAIAGAAVGEPVLRHTKPNVGRTYPTQCPDDSDAFDGPAFGLQWQWQANPQPHWYALLRDPSRLRLTVAAVPEEVGATAAGSPASSGTEAGAASGDPSVLGAPATGRPSGEPVARTEAVEAVAATTGLYHAPHLLLQKFPAEVFCAETKLDASALRPGQRAGLIVFGYRYAYAGLRSKADGSGVELILAEGDADGERVLWSTDVPAAQATLRVEVSAGAACAFAYALEDERFLRCSGDAPPFQATEGHWVGAKLGLFAAGESPASHQGHADFAWFRVSG
nr:glycoside hydrolase 43 family protein [Paenibacillus sabuli]